jgi:hypothetical protein
MLPTLKEFAVGDKTYHCTVIDLLKQVDLMQALSPILPVLIEAFAGMGEAKNNEEATKFALPVMTALHTIPNERLHFIIDECMSVCERLNDNSQWSKIWVAKSPQFMDINLGVMTKIVINVLRANLMDF